LINELFEAGKLNKDDLEHLKKKSGKNEDKVTQKFSALIEKNKKK
jgi:hypothetical protein